MLKLTIGLALVTLVACSQCPNNEFCEAGQSCCQDPTGEFSCCPFHHGECCEDHMHCCPESMLCNVTDFTCTNATHTLPLVERIPAKQTDLPKSFRMIPSLPVSEDDITCPDGSFCPAEFSCLLMTSSYGCCPVAQGLVCSDGKHCCPKFHECSADSSLCVKQKGQVETVLCGDGKSECPVDTTCCETEDGQWSCCPMPRAVCCDDKIHCCPEDSVCDVEGSKCMSSTNQELPMWDKFPARLRAEWEDHKPAEIRAEPQVTTTTQITTSGNQMTTLPGTLPENSDVPCDDTAKCEDGTTCCKTKDGGWACCPLPEAVCCDDFIHCCPHGTTCNVAAGSCDDPSGSSPWLEKVPVQPIISQNEAVTQVYSDVPCDETSKCEDGTTCCKTKDGGWACCPLPEAVCCDDFIHCCPHGTTCDVAAGSCDDPSGSSPWLEKVPVQPIISQNEAVTQVYSDVPCDETSKCEDGTTCCKTKDGGWACCPLPEAVCCDDFIHCCPHGTTCDVAAGSCDEPSGSSPWLEKVPVQPIISQNEAVTQVYSDVPCDETSKCEDGTTCCKTKDGGWACCPLPEAVCCDDFIHCCPHGTTCDVAAGSCDDPSGSSPWLEKVPVQPIISQNETVTQVYSDVPCDDTAKCEDGTTCCKTKDGGWACCPLPEAVCCDDFIHCCPHGTTCNVAAGSCDEPSASSPWLEKVPVQPVISQNVDVSQDVPCNDTVSCPDESTCCKTKDGGWACCPLPEAVCCEDFTHCCPHGKICNVAAGTCEDPSCSGVPWVEHGSVEPVISQIDTQNSDVPCDDTAKCEDGTTCCKTKDGGWACCPLPEAVCCDDFIHCCPHGTTCNVAAGSCDEPSASLPWAEKVPARPRADQRSNENVNCDSNHVCPDSNTCCKNVDGEWGCCPLPEAVCCWDKFHCCPHGTTCDIVTLTCKSNTTSVPMSDIISASDKEEQRQHEEVKEEVGKYDIRVPCDAHTSCPDHTTCCLIVKTNKWGCCPLPDAVCCTDGEHCCPAHYMCDVSRVSCIKGDVVIPWYNKIAAQSSLSPNSDLGTDKCDEKSICSADSTCCRLSTGEWGCCPLREAVCCSDQEHCCPKGYKCDLHRRSCIKTTWLYVERVTLVLIGVQKPQLRVSEKNIQCGGGYSCQDGQTCCQTSQSSWGCCSYSMAKCCDDMKHCCPAGYKCGAGGICTPSVGFDWNNWDSWRVFFPQKKRATTL